MSEAPAPASAPSGRGAPSRLLLGTAIGGGTGYLVTAIAGPALQPEGYASFAVFWSALYLILAALGGLQQEIARSATPVAATDVLPPHSLARRFAIVAAGIVFAVITGSAALWVGSVFPVGGWSLILPLALGAAAYIAVATVAGVFYGLSMWNAIALQMSLDGVIRLASVVLVLVFTTDPALLAWAVVLPFALAPLLIWPFVRGQVVGKYVLDVGARELVWNVFRTVVASAATGIMVSGLPLLLRATARGESNAELGVIIFAITLLRAPVVIVVMAMQSFLIVFFQQRVAAIWRTLAPMVTIILAVSGAISLVVWWLGPVVMAALFGEVYRLDGGLLALLVLSAGPVGALCATGAAALAQSRHGVFTFGWVIAALVTVAMLLVPNELSTRAVLALSVGPVVGLVAHVLLLLSGPRRRGGVPVR